MNNIWADQKRKKYPSATMQGLKTHKKSIIYQGTYNHNHNSSKPYKGHGPRPHPKQTQAFFRKLRYSKKEINAYKIPGYKPRRKKKKCIKNVSGKSDKKHQQRIIKPKKHVRFADHIDFRMYSFDGPVTVTRKTIPHFSHTRNDADTDDCYWDEKVWEWERFYLDIN